MIKDFISDRKIARLIAVLVFTAAVCFLFKNGFNLYTKLHGLDSKLHGLDSKLDDFEIKLKLIKKDIAIAFLYVAKFLDALASAIFIALWWNRTKDEPQKKHVYLWLCLAWLTWAIPYEPVSALDKLAYFLSQVNNLFLLWALRDFSEGGLREFEPYFKRVGITYKNYFLVTGAVIFAIIGLELAMLDQYHGEIIDIIVSSLTVLWLGWATSIAFVRRFIGYSGRAMALLAWICVFAAIGYQILHAFEKAPTLTIILGIFYQTGITLIISALTFSWAFFQLRQREKEAVINAKLKEKEAVISAKLKEDDMIHIIRNMLRQLELDIKQVSKFDYLRIGTARLLFEQIHINKPSKIFEFLKGAKLNNYLESVLAALKNTLQWNELEVDIAEIPVDFAVWETSAQKLARIVTEAGINAYKYSDGKKTSIKIALQADNIIVEIKDNGLGVDENSIKSAQGNGQGYTIIDVYLKDLKGLKKFPPVEHGTLVVFTIPIGKFLKYENTLT